MKKRKYPWILAIFILSITAIVYFTVFYETENEAWGKATTQNTIVAYKHFIESFPAAANIERAEDKIMHLKTPEGMIYVKGGTYQMGCTNEQGNQCQKDELPAHTVTVGSFYIGITEVTNTEYCEFLNAYGSDTVKSGKYRGKLMIIEWPWGIKKIGANSWQPQTGYENHPVVPLSWFGANEYCKWRACRLPTEAEWEYAARGGQRSKSTMYAGSNKLNDVAWYRGNSAVAKSTVPGEPGSRGTMPVKQKAPNELGIYDMTGNVWEWCEDWYDADFYGQSDKIKNPICDSGNKKLKVLRGGSWYDSAAGCHISDRGWRSPSGYVSVFGLRVVKSSL